ncbi:hypothetical protein JXR93_03375 [bacterium]|nr:hypothetical protein [bacterium]
MKWILFIAFLTIFITSCGKKPVEKDLKSLEIDELKTKEIKEVELIFNSESENLPQRKNTYIIKTADNSRTLLSEEFDFNRDGIIDSAIIYQNGAISKIYSDLDFDKNEDVIDIYQNGVISEREIINHISKTAYIKTFYDKDGSILKKETDSNLDNKMDIIVHYKDNIPYKREQDINFDGVMDTSNFIKEKKDVENQNDVK